MKIFLLRRKIVLGIMLGCFVMSFFSGGAVFAEVRDCAETNVLGFNSWDCGVDYENVTSEEDLKNVILGISFNILTDLTVAASYLVLGYVMWGGYKYMFSRGDAGKVAEGKKTLVNAFLGLAIVMLSSVIFSAIRGVIGGGTMRCVGGNVPLSDGTCPGGEIALPGTDGGLLVANMISWFMAMAGVVAVIFVVYGGISYITAAGDAGKLVKAKNAITYALIGLFIVILAEVITGFVAGQIRKSDETAIFNNEMPILAEEIYENTIS